MSIRDLPRRTRLSIYGGAIFFLLVWWAAFYRFLFQDYQTHIAILLSGVASLLFPLTPFYIIYKLAERKKRITKEADEYFENKHSEK